MGAHDIAAKNEQLSVSVILDFSPHQVCASRFTQNLSAPLLRYRPLRMASHYNSPTIGCAERIGYARVAIRIIFPLSINKKAVLVLSWI